MSSSRRRGKNTTKMNSTLPCSSRPSLLQMTMKRKKGKECESAKRDVVDKY
jgi:hypothetical protein